VALLCSGTQKTSAAAGVIFIISFTLHVWFGELLIVMVVATYLGIMRVLGSEGNNNL
jgi:hypothetical protein